MEYFKENYVSGSSVIEMSYIIPMFLIIFVVIIHTVFYYHDKLIMTGAACETAILGAQIERSIGIECNLEEFFKERLEGKLIYMTDPELKVLKTDKIVEATASVEVGFMKIAIHEKADIVHPEKRIRWMK